MRLPDLERQIEYIRSCIHTLYVYMKKDKNKPLLFEFPSFPGLGVL